jgi:3-phenylpropionate/trans-cinnamate dioxygenase ferredoxin subunit
MGNPAVVAGSFAEDDFVRVCGTAEVPAGTALGTSVGAVPVAVVHTGDEWFAIHDVCSHADIPLSEGEVDGCTLECWLHGSRFDLRTGNPSGLPATLPVPVYPVRVTGGEVFVSVTGNPLTGEPIAGDPTAGPA